MTITRHTDYGAYFIDVEYDEHETGLAGHDCWYAEVWDMDGKTVHVTDTVGKRVSAILLAKAWIDAAVIATRLERGFE